MCFFIEILQLTVELPYVFLQSLIFGTLVYSMVQFEWTPGKFFLFLFVVYFTLLVFTYWGMSTVALTPNAQVAAIISSAAFGIWNLFAGFLVPRPVSFFFFFFWLPDHFKRIVFELFDAKKASWVDHIK